jgi:hypothetical protein
MRFTDLMLHTHLISDGLEAISIIGHEHLGAYALGNRQSLVFERLDIFRWECIDG